MDGIGSVVRKIDPPVDAESYDRWAADRGYRAMSGWELLVGAVMVVVAALGLLLITGVL